MNAGALGGWVVGHTFSGHHLHAMDPETGLSACGVDAYESPSFSFPDDVTCKRCAAMAAKPGARWTVAEYPRGAEVRSVSIFRDGIRIAAIIPHRDGRDLGRKKQRETALEMCRLLNAAEAEGEE